ncbi:unnamed protein product [Acanthoscelides obtectus]|uniref:Sec23/Sec24 helical domain-containing protein n=1 Tax=Acanthoscelides obtectus TaxID=200917 RepID=A0A9P0KZW7_ACAOB|nr:unnamed protein product [Acanthoscelides obtectus]CAK1626309.1 Protein transport protein Sec24A [Acanthoscelides obtectus]
MYRRSLQASVSDAREAFINVAIDILSSYKMSLNMNGPSSGLLAPTCLKLLPLYISAIMKHTAFRTGVFLLDAGDQMIMLVCQNAPTAFLNDVLNVPSYAHMPDDLYELPTLNNLRNQRVHFFIYYLNEDKPYSAPLHIIRDNSSNRVLFYQRLVEDRMENALSYHEFLQHLKTQVK